MQLPPELLQQVFEHLADSRNIKQLLRLRHVSSQFDAFITSATVFPRSTSYRDIVSCEEKDLVLKYLSWHQDQAHRMLLNEAEHTTPVFDLLERFAVAFKELARDKYSYQKIIQIVHSLFAHQLLIQSLQYHSERHWWSQRSRFNDKFLYWCPGSMEATLKSSIATSQQACVVIACALGDEEILDAMVSTAIYEHSSTDELQAQDTTAVGGDEHLSAADHSTNLLNCDHILGRPLQAAIWHGQSKMVSTLMQRCDLLYTGVLNALKDAVLTRQHNTLQQLLQYGADIFRQQQDHGLYTKTENCVGDALALACRYNDEISCEIIYPFAKPLSQADLEFTLFSACLGGAQKTGLQILATNPTMDVNFQVKWSAGKFKTKTSTSRRFPVAEAAVCTALSKALLA